MLASGAANQGYGSDYVESPADIARNVVYMITQQYLSGRSKNKPTVIVIFDGYMRASIKKRGDYSNLYHRAQLQAQDILLRIQRKNPGQFGFIIIRSVAEADFDVLKLEQDFAKIKPITRDATQVFVEPAPAHTSAATIEGEDREHIEEEVMRIARAIDEARDALNLVGVGAEDDLDTDEAIDQSREVHQKGQPQDGGEEVVLPEYINDHSDSPADQGAADFIRCRVVSNDGDLFMHSDATTLIAEGRQCAGNIFKVNTADFLAKVKDEIVKRNLDGKHASLIAFMTFAFLGDYRMINYKGMGEVAFFNIIANALEAAQDVQEGDAAEESAGGIHARRFFASIARQFAKARTEKKIGSLSKEELISLHTDDLREINEQVVRHVNDAIKSVAFACAPLGVCDSLLKCMPRDIRVYLKERTGIDISAASSKPSAGVYLSTSPHIVLLRQLLMIKSGHSHLINNQQISIPEAMSSWIAELGVTGVPGYGTRLEEHPFEPLRKSKVPQVEHDKFLELMEGIKPIPQSLLPVDMARRRTDSDASMTELMGSDDEDLPVGDQPSSRAAHDRTARPKLFLDPSEAGDSAHTAAELQDPIFKAVSVIASNYRQREEDRRAAWIRVDAERRSQAAALFSRVLKKKLFQDVDCSGADAADRLIRFHQTEYLPPYRLDALTEAVNRLEMSLTAFDQPVIDLLGSSDILMMLLEGHNRPHKDATRVVFRILYEIVSKHRKDERCQAAQHLAKRLWSSQAARQYCLRLSNTARVLGMAHVVGIDGNFADGLTDPLILHTGDVSGATLPWTWLERFCHHLASTHIPYEDIQYLDARGATDKIYIDLGYSLEDALDGRLASPCIHHQSSVGTGTSHVKANGPSKVRRHRSASQSSTELSGHSEACK